MQPYQFLGPTKVIFAAGSGKDPAAQFPPLGRRALIVCGRRSARALGLLDTLTAQFPGAVVFDQVEENPSTQTCALGARICREHGCDWIIAAGGGSPLDAAKAIAVLAHSSSDLRELFLRPVLGERVLPLVAIPTTAGTGSEVTPYAVLVDEEEGEKRTIRGESLFPKVALLDPELTVSLPREVTIATGLDALSQGMEGYVSLRSTPLGDVLALEVVRLVRRWLPVAVREPENLEARGQMMHAAMLSGCVIAQSGTTLVHGMGYYYTLRCGLAHGLANGLLLGPVFRFNAKHLPDKVADLARALGAAESGDSGDDVRVGLARLFSEIGLDVSASAAGVREEQLAAFAADIVGEPGRFKNQVGALGEPEVLQLYRESWEGSCLSACGRVG